MDRNINNVLSQVNPSSTSAMQNKGTHRVSRKLAALKKILQAHDEGYCSSTSQNLARYIRRYITESLRYHRNSPKFAKEIYGKIISLHEYNCKLAEIKGKYPRSRYLRMLLVRYVELEFEILYKQENYSRQYECEVENRLLRLTQMTIFDIVLNPRVTCKTNIENTCISVLKFFSQVVKNFTQEQLNKYRILNRIVDKLGEKIGGVPGLGDLIKKHSDYGSDESCSGSDSDDNLDTSDSGISVNLNDFPVRVSKQSILPVTSSPHPVHNKFCGVKKKDLNHLQNETIIDFVNLDSSDEDVDNPAQKVVTIDLLDKESDKYHIYWDREVKTRQRSNNSKNNSHVNLRTGACRNKDISGAITEPVLISSDSEDETSEVARSRDYRSSSIFKNVSNVPIFIKQHIPSISCRQEDQHTKSLEVALKFHTQGITTKLVEQVVCDTLLNLTESVKSKTTTSLESDLPEDLGNESCVEICRTNQDESERLHSVGLTSVDSGSSSYTSINPFDNYSSHTNQVANETSIHKESLIEEHTVSRNSGELHTEIGVPVESDNDQHHGIPMNTLLPNIDNSGLVLHEKRDFVHCRVPITNHLDEHAGLSHLQKKNDEDSNVDASKNTYINDVTNLDTLSQVVNVQRNKLPSEVPEKNDVKGNIHDIIAENLNRNISSIININESQKLPDIEEFKSTNENRGKSRDIVRSEGMLPDVFLQEKTKKKVICNTVHESSKILKNNVLSKAAYKFYDGFDDNALPSKAVTARQRRSQDCILGKRQTRSSHKLEPKKVASPKKVKKDEIGLLHENEPDKPNKSRRKQRKNNFPKNSLQSVKVNMKLPTEVLQSLNKFKSPERKNLEGNFFDCIQEVSPLERNKARLKKLSKVLARCDSDQQFFNSPLKTEVTKVCKKSKVITSDNASFIGDRQKCLPYETEDEVEVEPIFSLSTSVKEALEVNDSQLSGEELTIVTESDNDMLEEIRVNSEEQTEESTIETQENTSLVESSDVTHCIDDANKENIGEAPVPQKSPSVERVQLVPDDFLHPYNAMCVKIHSQIEMTRGNNSDTKNTCESITETNTGDADNSQGFKIENKKYDLMALVETSSKVSTVEKLLSNNSSFTKEEKENSVVSEIISNAKDYLNFKKTGDFQLITDSKDLNFDDKNINNTHTSKNVKEHLSEHEVNVVQNDLEQELSQNDDDAKNLQEQILNDTHTSENVEKHDSEYEVNKAQKDIEPLELFRKDDDPEILQEQIINVTHTSQNIKEHNSEYGVNEVQKDLEKELSQKNDEQSNNSFHDESNNNSVVTKAHENCSVISEICEIDYISSDNKDASSKCILSMNTAQDESLNNCDNSEENITDILVKETELFESRTVPKDSGKLAPALVETGNTLIEDCTLEIVNTSQILAPLSDFDSSSSVLSEHLEKQNETVSSKITKISSDVAASFLLNEINISRELHSITPDGASLINNHNKDSFTCDKKVSIQEQKTMHIEKIDGINLNSHDIRKLDVDSNGVSLRTDLGKLLISSELDNKNQQASNENIVSKELDETNAAIHNEESNSIEIAKIDGEECPNLVCENIKGNEVEISLISSLSSASGNQSRTILENNSDKTAVFERHLDDETVNELSGNVLAKKKESNIIYEDMEQADQSISESGRVSSNAKSNTDHISVNKGKELISESSLEATVSYFDTAGNEDSNYENKEGASIRTTGSVEHLQEVNVDDIAISLEKELMKSESVELPLESHNTISEAKVSDSKVTDKVAEEEEFCEIKTRKNDDTQTTVSELNENKQQLINHIEQGDFAEESSNPLPSECFIKISNENVLVDYAALELESTVTSVGQAPQKHRNRLVLDDTHNDKSRGVIDSSLSSTENTVSTHLEELSSNLEIKHTEQVDGNEHNFTQELSSKPVCTFKVTENHLATGNQPNMNPGDTNTDSVLTQAAVSVGKTDNDTPIFASLQKHENDPNPIDILPKVIQESNTLEISPDCCLSKVMLNKSFDENVDSNIFPDNEIDISDSVVSEKDDSLSIDKHDEGAMLGESDPNSKQNCLNAAEGELKLGDLQAESSQSNTHIAEKTQFQKKYKWSKNITLSKKLTESKVVLGEKVQDSICHIDTLASGGCEQTVDNRIPERTLKNDEVQETSNKYAGKTLSVKSDYEKKSLTDIIVAFKQETSTLVSLKEGDGNIDGKEDELSLSERQSSREPNTPEKRKMSGTENMKINEEHKLETDALKNIKPPKKDKNKLTKYVPDSYQSGEMEVTDTPMNKMNARTLPSKVGCLTESKPPKKDKVRLSFEMSAYCDQPIENIMAESVNSVLNENILENCNPCQKNSNDISKSNIPKLDLECRVILHSPSRDITKGVEDTLNIKTSVDPPVIKSGHNARKRKANIGKKSLNTKSQFIEGCIQGTKESFKLMNKNIRDVKSDSSINNVGMNIENKEMNKSSKAKVKKVFNDALRVEFEKVTLNKVANKEKINKEPPVIPVKRGKPVAKPKPKSVDQNNDIEITSSDSLELKKASKALEDIGYLEQVTPVSDSKELKKNKLKKTNEAGNTDKQLDSERITPKNLNKKIRGSSFKGSTDRSVNTETSSVRSVDVYQFTGDSEESDIERNQHGARNSNGSKIVKGRNKRSKINICRRRTRSTTKYESYIMLESNKRVSKKGEVLKENEHTDGESQKGDVEQKVEENEDRNNVSLKSERKKSKSNDNGNNSEMDSKEKKIINVLENHTEKSEKSKEVTKPEKIPQRRSTRISTYYFFQDSYDQKRKYTRKKSLSEHSEINDAIVVRTDPCNDKSQAEIVNISGIAKESTYTNDTETEKNNTKSAICDLETGRANTESRVKRKRSNEGKSCKSDVPKKKTIYKVEVTTEDMPKTIELVDKKQDSPPKDKLDTEEPSDLEVCSESSTKSKITNKTFAGAGKEEDDKQKEVLQHSKKPIKSNKNSREMKKYDSSRKENFKIEGNLVISEKAGKVAESVKVLNNSQNQENPKEDGNVHNINGLSSHHADMQIDVVDVSPATNKISKSHEIDEHESKILMKNPDDAEKLVPQIESQYLGSSENNENSANTGTMCLENKIDVCPQTGSESSKDLDMNRDSSDVKITYLPSTSEIASHSENYYLENIKNVTINFLDAEKESSKSCKQIVSHMEFVENSKTHITQSSLEAVSQQTGEEIPSLMNFETIETTKEASCLNVANEHLHNNEALDSQTVIQSSEVKKEKELHSLNIQSQYEPGDVKLAVNIGNKLASVETSEDNCNSLANVEIEKGDIQKSEELSQNVKNESEQNCDPVIDSKNDSLLNKTASSLSTKSNSLIIIEQNTLTSSLKNQEEQTVTTGQVNNCSNVDLDILEPIKKHPYHDLVHKCPEIDSSVSSNKNELVKSDEALTRDTADGSFDKFVPHLRVENKNHQILAPSAKSTVFSTIKQKNFADTLGNEPLTSKSDSSVFQTYTRGEMSKIDVENTELNIANHTPDKRKHLSDDKPKTALDISAVPSCSIEVKMSETPDIIGEITHSNAEKSYDYKNENENKNSTNKVNKIPIEETIERVKKALDTQINETNIMFQEEIIDVPEIGQETCLSEDTSHSDVVSSIGELDFGMNCDIADQSILVQSPAEVIEETIITDFHIDTNGEFQESLKSNISNNISLDLDKSENDSFSEQTIDNHVDLLIPDFINQDDVICGNLVPVTEITPVTPSSVSSYEDNDISTSLSMLHSLSPVSVSYTSIAFSSCMNNVCGIPTSVTTASSSQCKLVNTVTVQGSIGENCSSYDLLSVGPGGPMITQGLPLENNILVPNSSEKRPSLSDTAEEYTSNDNALCDLPFNSGTLIEEEYLPEKDNKQDFDNSEEFKIIETPIVDSDDVTNLNAPDICSDPIKATEFAISNLVRLVNQNNVDTNISAPMSPYDINNMNFLVQIVDSVTDNSSLDDSILTNNQEDITPLNTPEDIPTENPFPYKASEPSDQKVIVEKVEQCSPEVTEMNNCFEQKSGNNKDTLTSAAKHTPPKIRDHKPEVNKPLGKNSSSKLDIKKMTFGIAARLELPARKHNRTPVLAPSRKKPITASSNKSPVEETSPKQSLTNNENVESKITSNDLAESNEKNDLWKTAAERKAFDTSLKSDVAMENSENSHNIGDSKDEVDSTSLDFSGGAYEMVKIKKRSCANKGITYSIDSILHMPSTDSKSNKPKKKIMELKPKECKDKQIPIPADHLKKMKVTFKEEDTIIPNNSSTETMCKATKSRSDNKRVREESDDRVKSKKPKIDEKRNDAIFDELYRQGNVNKLYNVDKVHSEKKSQNDNTSFSHSIASRYPRRQGSQSCRYVPADKPSSPSHSGPYEEPNLRHSRLRYRSGEHPYYQGRYPTQHHYEHRTTHSVPYHDKRYSSERRENKSSYNLSGSHSSSYEYSSRPRSTGSSLEERYQHLSEEEFNKILASIPNRKRGQRSQMKGDFEWLNKISSHIDNPPPNLFSEPRLKRD